MCDARFYSSCVSGTSDEGVSRVGVVPRYARDESAGGVEADRSVHVGVSVAAVTQCISDFFFTLLEYENKSDTTNDGNDTLLLFFYQRWLKMLIATQVKVRLEISTQLQLVVVISQISEV